MPCTTSPRAVGPMPAQLELPFGLVDSVSSSAFTVASLRGVGLEPLCLRTVVLWYGGVTSLESNLLLSTTSRCACLSLCSLLGFVATESELPHGSCFLGVG